MSEQESIPPGVDVSVPSTARVYDYYLDGTHNFAADRAAAEQVRALVPETYDSAWSNRGFHQRAAAWMVAEAGIDQFIDLGSGLPTQSNTHDLVQGLSSGAVVVYVDNDPAVQAYAGALLAEVPRTALINGDVRDPGSVLNHPELRGLIDLDRPVGILATAVFHFIADHEDPVNLVRAYMEAVPSGSCLALSQACHDKASEDLKARVEAVYANASSKLYTRSRVDIERLFSGLELVAPYNGAAAELTYPGFWAADTPELADDEGQRWFLAGVARKP